MQKLYIFRAFKIVEQWIKSPGSVFSNATTTAAATLQKGTWLIYNLLSPRPWHDPTRADLSMECHSSFGLDNFLLWCFVLCNCRLFSSSPGHYGTFLVIITQTVSRLYQISLGVGTGAKSMLPWDSGQQRKKLPLYSPYSSVETPNSKFCLVLLIWLSLTTLLHPLLHPKPQPKWIFCFCLQVENDFTTQGFSAHWASPEHLIPPAFMPTNRTCIRGPDAQLFQGLSHIQHSGERGVNYRCQETWLKRQAISWSIYCLASFHKLWNWETGRNHTGQHFPNWFFPETVLTDVNTHIDICDAQVSLKNHLWSFSHCC